MEFDLTSLLLHERVLCQNPSLEAEQLSRPQATEGVSVRASKRRVSTLQAGRGSALFAPVVSLPLFYFHTGSGASAPVVLYVPCRTVELLVIRYLYVKLQVVAPPGFEDMQPTTAPDALPDTSLGRAERMQTTDHASKA